MPNLIQIRLAIVFFLISFSANANNVVVFGTVKFPDGSVATNFPITIQPDSIVCQVTTSILTNQNGAFETAINCDKPVVKTIISYIDCEGHVVQVVKEVPATLKVEYNIILCKPLNCHAQFEATRSSTTNFNFKFNSSGSYPSLTVPDEIVSREWSWGDGTSTEGNITSPNHTFPADSSSYNVCLKITTREGCISYSCQKISVATPHTECKANYKWLAATNNHSEIHFTDSSHTTAGDSIISRSWSWGDGTSTGGNITNPIHTFPRDSTYNVCLKIATRTGCFSSSCQNVTVISSYYHCEAGFRFENITGEQTNPPKTYIKFFSGNSAGTSNTDVIICRRWTFGDGTGLTSNDSNIVHSYLHGGNYTVCLYIKTTKGCYDSVCKEVYVLEPGIVTAACHASLEFENTGDGKLRFNSKTSYGLNQGDSIIKRNWIFGDGSSVYGNNMAPLHVYSAAGTYTACLVIVTASGCENRACTQVTVNGIMPSDSVDVSLENCFPNPASTNLYATVWSKHQNLTAKMDVYDVYGTFKWSKQIILPQGSSTWPVPTQTLLAGPYLLKLITQYGVQYLNFIKMN